MEERRTYDAQKKDWRTKRMGKDTAQPGQLSADGAVYAPLPVPDHYPLISAVGLSFTNFNMLELPRFVGWQNYQRMLLDDPVFFKVVKNTTALCVPDRPGRLSAVLPFCMAD